MLTQVGEIKKSWPFWRSRLVFKSIGFRKTYWTVLGYWIVGGGSSYFDQLSDTKLIYHLSGHKSITALLFVYGIYPRLRNFTILRIEGLRVGFTFTGNLLSNRTFHNQKLRSNTILNVRGFYQIASG